MGSQRNRATGTEISCGLTAAHAHSLPSRWHPTPEYPFVREATPRPPCLHGSRDHFSLALNNIPLSEWTEVYYPVTYRRVSWLLPGVGKCE